MARSGDLQGFLLRHGRVHAGKKGWTVAYRHWLTTIRFEHPAQQIVRQDYIHAVTDAEARVERLTRSRDLHPRPDRPLHLWRQSEGDAGHRDRRGRIKAVLDRSGIDPAKVGTIVMGNVIQAGNRMNPGRQAAINGGIRSRCRR